MSLPVGSPPGSGMCFVRVYLKAGNMTNGEGFFA